MCIVEIDNKDIIYIPNFTSVSVFNSDYTVHTSDKRQTEGKKQPEVHG